MDFAEQLILRLRRLPLQRTGLWIAALWGLFAGLTFTFARVEQAWMFFIGGYQSILLVAVIVAVLRGVGDELRRGEWNRAIAIGFGTTLALTALYLGMVALTSFHLPMELVALPTGINLQRKPEMLSIAPGMLLASTAVGAVLGPGFMLLSPERRLGRRRRAQPVQLPTATAPVFRGGDDPYTHGSLRVRTTTLAEGEAGAPAGLVVHAPVAAGAYPVVLFHHGFMLTPICYTILLRHLASHGFVVVAPLLHRPGHNPLTKPSTLAEAELAERIIAWMHGSLDRVAGATVRADLLGLVGHSRGAKTMWRLLKADPTLAHAVAGIDPVDGKRAWSGDPRLLGEPLGFSRPALVIGTELGRVVQGPFSGPCAPVDSNHEKFFAACASPAWHVVVQHHGHLDMLDDSSTALPARRGLCARGPQREAMRRLTAGLLTAFFRATLQGDAQAFGYLHDAAAAPLPVTMARR